MTGGRGIREASFSRSTRILKRAIAVAKGFKTSNAYPCPKEDKETRAFVRYWFDGTKPPPVTTDTHRT